MRTLRTLLVLSLLTTGIALLPASVATGADDAKAEKAESKADAKADAKAEATAEKDDKADGDAETAAARRAADAKPLREEGFIGHWLVVGPIKLGDEAASHEEQTQKPMFDREYFEGQKQATPKAGDKTAKDGSMAWKAAETDGATLDLEKFANDAGKEPLNALYLGTTYVVAAKEMPELKLSIGSDDSSVWWVNGKEVIRVYAGRAVENDQDKSEPITLKKGPNVVKFAVINGEGPVGISAHFLDKDDKPVTEGLTVSLTPPATKATKEPRPEAVPAKAKEEKD